MDIMATDIPVGNDAPITAGRELQPPSVVEQWTPKDLFDYKLIQKILWNDKNRATFQKAEISGNEFLNDGDVRDSWLHLCSLPLGPSGEIARLAQTIKNMGKKESRGKAFHLGSVELANTFTVQSPPPPEKWVLEITRLKFLHGLLWGKKDSLRGTVFCTFQHLLWNRDTDPHINGDIRTAVKLSPSVISGGAQLEGVGFLPCEADELLVRKAYVEMYDILLNAQEDRLKHIQKSERSERLGFLSYVLVWRLLEGKPTIFQLAKFDSASNPNSTHYLLDENGVRQIDSASIDELRNPDIWVLADHKPVGGPRLAGGRKWLVVVTSLPRKDNYHYLVKEYSPQKYYLPSWDWEEVVASA